MDNLKHSYRASFLESASSFGFPRARLCAMIVVMLSMMAPGLVKAGSIMCSEMHSLAEHSKNGFASIQGRKNAESDDIDATVWLADADQCGIIQDPEKNTYRCTWSFPVGIPDARALFQNHAKVISECIGVSTNVLMDQPVNHPDTYESLLYRLSDTDVRVTLKDKRQLRRTFVSVAIVGASSYQKGSD